MKYKTGNVLFLIVSAILLFYTLYRAAHVCFTYDESRSYFEFSRIPVYFIFKFPFPDANNHVLNSVLMKFMGAFGPPGQLLLRTPNLCAHILFLVSTWLLLSSVKDMRLRICLFIIVNTNPFMLDYFSMARGYGLSMGFMAMSLYFLKEFMENKKNNWLLHQSMALFGAILAVLSNFSMLMYYFGLCLVMAIWILNMVLRHGFTLKQFLQSTTCFLIAFLPIFLYVLPKIWQLKSAGAFYYGGNQGF